MLLAKGQNMNSRMIERLKHYHLTDSRAPSGKTYTHETHAPYPVSFHETSVLIDDRRTCSKHLQKIDTTAIESMFQPCDRKIFELSTSIVSDIIFGSENESWKLIINTLCHRYAWVYTHSINVALLSLIIAENTGIDKKQLKNLAVGALFHDVGKILIPKEIIDKKTSLSDKEMAFMRQHCELGVNLVDAYDLPEESLSVILQHHERLDGSGYPYGLKSGDIHPLAKITMIADVLDAITSARPYRPAKSIGEAILIIKQEGGKFSPEYVAAIEKLHKIMR